MGIFSRISRFFRANVNSVIEKAEGSNPEKVLNQSLEDMEKSLRQAKAALASAMADAERLRSEGERDGISATEWENRAGVAIKGEKDDMAKQALVRRNQAATSALEKVRLYQESLTQIDGLKKSVRDMQDKVEELRRRKSLIIVKHNHTTMIKTMNGAISGMDDKSAFAAFARMEEKVNQNERTAQATLQIEDEMKGTTLDNEFKALEATTSSGDIDAALAQLKATMLLGPPPAPKSLPAPTVPPHKLST